jgi:non-canonical purine NTP pyrophosphatase (RdgB/HAM1 family)
MKDFVFVTGNQNKANDLAKRLGLPVEHHRLDLDELQSLDLRTVLAHKVRQAYATLGRPVLVEDVALTFTAMGRLPGPLVKWFLEEIGPSGLCRLADSLDHRRAVASIGYAFHDGSHTTYFEHSTVGEVASEPRGSYGFGWDATFIPDGTTKTYAEMTADEVGPYSMRAHAIDALREFLVS